MAAAIPTTGGLWDLIAGKNTCPDFGLYGLSVASFATAVSGVSDTDHLSKVADAGVTLAEMASSLPTSGGLWDLLAGKNTCPDFGEFGESICAFAENVKSVSTSDVDKGVSAGNKIGEMLKNLPKEGGAWSIISGDLKLNKLDDNLTNLGKAISNFAEKASGAKNIDTAISNVNKLSSSLSAFVGTGINSISTSISIASPTIVSEFSDMISSMISAANGKHTAFKTYCSILDRYQLGKTVSCR